MFARFEIGVVGFSTIFVMLPVRVGHDDAEALVVLDLLHPDDPVGVGALARRERSASKIVSTKMMSTGWSTYGCASFTAPAVPSCTFCSMNTAGSGVLRPRVLLDLFLQVAGDVDDLLDVAELLEVLHHVRHHRLAGDLEHRLGREVRVRTEPRALAGQRNDDFHGALVPSRP